MAIQNRQIGWSQESNLLWQILKQINKLTSVIFGLKEAATPKYKVYTASLTQTGTDPAVVIVLENTIDPGITFNALGNGDFEIISPLGAFTLNKTVGFPVMFGDDGDSPLVSYTIFNDVTGTYGALYVRRIDGTPASIIGDDNANVRCPIEIRVYN
jgi:hypothetical protein